MLKQDEILTLDDNKKYSVAYTTILNSKNYVYLVDQNDYTNTMFCEYNNNDELEEVTDSNIIEKLLINFKNDINK